MAYSTSGGPKGLGQITPSASTVSDFNQIIDLIAMMGNFRGALTEAERDDITGDHLYFGLAVVNTDTGSLEMYDGSGWAVIGGIPATGTIATVAGVTWDATLVGIGNRVFLEGRAYKAAGSFSSGETAGTIPAGFRPVRTETFLATPMVTASAAWHSGAAYLLNSGVLTVNMTGIASINVVGFNASWRRA